MGAVTGRGGRLFDLLGFGASAAYNSAVFFGNGFFLLDRAFSLTSLIVVIVLVYAFRDRLIPWSRRFGTFVGQIWIAFQEGLNEQTRKKP